MLGFVPPPPATIAHAAANLTRIAPLEMDGLSAARVAAIRDSGPPVMAAASAAEAAAVSGPFVASHLVQASVTNKRLYREVFGFAFASSLGDPEIGYPSWNFGLLSTVAYFGLHVTWNGQFSNDAALATWNNASGPVPGLVNLAHAYGTKVVLTIIMMDTSSGTPNMCNALENGAVTIRNTVAQVKAKGVDGVNIDYESNNADCVYNTGERHSSQSLLTSFVMAMRAALPSGSYLSIDTYSGSAGYRSDSTYYGFFDIGALQSYVDSFFVMAYDMEYANFDSAPLNCVTFCLSPTAPLSAYLFNDSRASSEYTAVVPPSKVIMGIPYYGRKGCVPGFVPKNAPPSASATRVQADGYLDASAEDGYAANSDYQTHREQQDIRGATRWDTFTSAEAGCTREIYWDDVVALGNKYNLVINDHLRGIGIFALNYGGGAPELWSLINLKFGQCSEAAIEADHGSPQIPSAVVRFNATALCAGVGTFRFSLQKPGGSLAVVQEYSPISSWSWDTSALSLGTYTVQVDARNAGAAARLDTSARMTFRLARCVTPTLRANQPSPQLLGTSIRLTAATTCVPRPEYQFSEQDPSGNWVVVRPYGPSRVFNWDTTTESFGDYQFMVSARAAGTTVASETTQSLSYSLTSCVSATLAAAPDSPQPTGSQIRLTAKALCLGPAEYRFLVQAPGASWSTAEDFRPVSTFTWNASGPAGVYELEVDARMAGAAASTASTMRIAYWLTACVGARVWTTPPSPVMTGERVIIRGAATCDGTPEYRFWVGGAVVGDWSTASQLTWDTTGLRDGVYTVRVDVRNIGAAVTTYETFQSQPIKLEAPPPSYRQLE
jgi:spore germination protein YaaH